MLHVRCLTGWARAARAEVLEITGLRVMDQRLLQATQALVVLNLSELVNSRYTVRLSTPERPEHLPVELMR